MVLLRVFTIHLGICVAFSDFVQTQDGETLPTQLVYDVTGKEVFLGNHLCNNSTATTIRPSDIELTDSVYWQTLSLPPNDTTLPENVTHRLNLLKNDIARQGIDVHFGMLFENNALCSVFKSLTSQNLDVGGNIVIPIVKNETNTTKTCNSICTSLQRQLTSYQENLGIDLGEEDLNCIYNSCQRVFEYIGYTIVNIPLQQMSTFLTYSGFRRVMDNLHQKRTSEWYRVKGKFIFRFDVYQGEGIEDSKSEQLKEHLLQFSSWWLKHTLNGNAKIHIIARFSPTFEYQESPDYQHYKAIAYPDIPSEQLLEQAEYGSISPCALLRTLKSMSGRYETFFIKVDNWAQSKIFTANCTPFVTFSASDNISILIYGEENLEFVKELKNETKYYQHVFPTLIFLRAINWTKDTLYVNSSEQVQHISSSFKNTLQFPLIILLDKVIPPNEEFYSALPKLEQVLIRKEELERNYRNATFLINFKISETNSTGPIVYNNKYLWKNFYCNENSTRTKELQEALIVWASIHNLTLIPFPVINTGSTMGWSYDVVTKPILKTDANFPVTVRRNVPKDLEVDSHCVKMNPYDYFYVPYERETLIGTTLNLDQLSEIVALNATHIQNLLLIAFDRYRIVELQVLDSSLLQVVSEAFTNDFKEAISIKIHRKVEDIVLYVNVNWQPNLLQNIEQLLKFAPEGIHLSNWENVGDEDEKEYLKLVELLNTILPDTKIALNIQDCFQEIDSGFNKSRNHRFLYHAKYVVCQSDGTLASNEEEIQPFLDTFLYMQQYFEFNLNKTTYFRFNYYFLDCYDSYDSFNRFAYYLTLYAEIYDLHSFVGDAYTNCSGWKITNYNDLFNLSSYFQMPHGPHANVSLFGYIPPPKNDERGINLPVAVAVPTASVASFSIFIFLFVCYRRRKLIFLTKKEEEEFREGEVSEESDSVEYPENGDTELSRQQWKGSGFNKEFEISKTLFVLGDQIGRGNFGQVFQGMLNQTTTVAIKQPNSECSKEAFKTMLSEAKILSYIGEHDNLLKFIGAYTKEIRKGVIYILTEFCENGTLEGYLKKTRGYPDSSDSDYETLSSTLSEQYSLSDNYTTNDSQDSIYSDISAYLDNTRSGYTSFDIDSLENQEQGQDDESSPVIIFTELSRFCLEISRGMEYISERKVVHSDLSTRNVLLTASKTCKISDFGLSRKLYERTAYIKKGQEALPWRWMALESLKNMEFTTKSDVWGYGVTLWEIFSLGDTPYPGIFWDPTFTSKLQEGLRLSKPEQATEEIYKKMLLCWTADPTERPSFTELREFFENLTEEKDEYVTAC